MHESPVLISHCLVPFALSILVQPTLHRTVEGGRPLDEELYDFAGHGSLEEVCVSCTA